MAFKPNVTYPPPKGSLICRHQQRGTAALVLDTHACCASSVGLCTDHGGHGIAQTEVSLWCVYAWYSLVHVFVLRIASHVGTRSGG